LHKIFARFYRHKVKGVRSKRRPMYGWWGGWKKWVPKKIECRPSRHGPLFCFSKCGINGSMMLVCHFKFYTKYF
jgi:hypothetical protein